MSARARRRRSLRHARPIAALALLAGTARADLSLEPAADGAVGAWLAATDIPKGATPLDFAPPAANALAGPRLGAVRFNLIDGGTAAAIDLRKTAARGTRTRRLALAAVLRTPAALDGWLFLSVDGHARVAVDGKMLWERPEPHPRGGGWDAIRLELAPGDHPLVVLLENGAPAWAVEARVLGAADLSPPKNVEWRLPGTSVADEQRITLRLLRATASAGLVPAGFQPRVRFEFPRGSPGTPAEVSLVPGAGTAEAPPLRFELPRSDRGFLGVDVPLPERVGTARLDSVRVVLGGESRRLPLFLDAQAPKVVERALAVRDRLMASPPVPRRATDVLAASLEYDVELSAVLADRADAPAATAARGRLESFVAKLEAGRDPMDDPGVLSLARRSRLDGEPQRFALHVPAKYEAGSDARYPLVVVLHGYGGYPERVMSAFLGTDSAAPHPRVDGFVLAPHAHGDAFYRGPGETEVMDLVEWALSRYPIDPRRVSVTGISMGGTGAAHFAFRFPDHFAAAGALAGYHSYFVRRDVRGRELRAWEIAELARHSPASFAENGLGTFLFLAQGTQDLPLWHTTSLAGRYRELGYPLRESYPDTGHDVYRVSWASASLFPALAKFARDPVPREIMLKTDSLRLGKRGWVRITGLESSSAPAAVSARVTTRDTIVLRTQGATALELVRPLPHVDGGAPLRVDADGVALSFEANESLTLHRGATSWEKGPLPPTPLAKKPGVEGPIRDAFSAPLTFVYGTLDPRESLAARQVAEHFRARWSGSARFPVVADVLVGAPRGRNYFLVGSRTSNRVVRELDARLPFGIEGDAVRLGTHRIEGDAELGLCAVFPNPEDPEHVIVVVEGRGLPGLVRSMSLPSQLPDFIVFDSAVAPAAGEQVLGRARVRAAGYFDRAWGVPSILDDAPLPPTGPRAAALWGPKPRAFAWERRILGAAEPAPPP